MRILSLWMLSRIAIAPWAIPESPLQSWKAASASAGDCDALTSESYETVLTEGVCGLRTKCIRCWSSPPYLKNDAVYLFCMKESVHET